MSIWLPFQINGDALPLDTKAANIFWSSRLLGYTFLVHNFCGLGYKEGRLKPPCSLDFKPWVFFSGETLAFEHNCFNERFAALSEKSITSSREGFILPEY